MFVATFINGMGVLGWGEMGVPLHARQTHPCWLAGSIVPPKPLN